MKKALIFLCGGLLGFAALGAVPASAGPVTPIHVATPAGEQATQPTLIQDRRHRRWIRRGNHDPRAFHRGWSSARHLWRQGPPHHWPRRHYRPHYGSGVYITIGPRYYEPYYYPRRVYRPVRGNSHIRWCYARYKTYRAWDNSYVANRYGDRRQCVSPYGRWR